MDIEKGKLAKNLIIKAWKRCSLTNQSSSKRKKSKDRVLAPDGCFSVYVGPEKQRFVVKVEFANHPLFKVLLEDAAWEYGYSSGGPIMLPCDVELFYNILAEMENNVDDDMMSTQRFFLQTLQQSNSSSSFKFEQLFKGLWWCLYAAYSVTCLS
ncbi:auxin-responsive protein SAUR71-like [Rosa sericea]